MFFGGLANPPFPHVKYHFSAEPPPPQNCHTVMFKAYFFNRMFNFFDFNKLWVKVPLDGYVIEERQIVHSYHCVHSCVELN